MAAVSHLRNKKEAKQRESIEKLISKISINGGPVSVKSYLEMLETSGIEPDSKEVGRIQRLAKPETGQIDRDDFLAYAKKSTLVKELLDGERSRKVDKAQLAFKAIDTDNSGYITAGELSKLGSKMNQEKTDALMLKLDSDGDGKITLKEFRALFKNK